MQTFDAASWRRIRARVLNDPVIDLPLVSGGFYSYIHGSFDVDYAVLERSRSWPIAVSVIMPAYNCGKYIVRAIESVRRQTFTDWELVIVDDGSADETESVVCDRFSNDSRIRYIKTAHGGVGRASKKAVEATQGRFLCQLDADDLLSRNALKILHAVLDARPRASLVFGGCIRFPLSSIGFCLPKKFRQGSLLASMKAYHPRMFRRVAYDATEGYDPRLDAAVDYDMCLKLEEIGDVVSIRRILYAYRIRKDSISGASYSRQCDSALASVNAALQRRRVPLQAVAYRFDRPWFDHGNIRN